MDMWVQVAVGQLVPSAVVPPSIFWAGLSIAGLALALQFVQRRLIVALPFFANGALALFASVVHSGNSPIGLGLIGLGAAILWCRTAVHAKLPATGDARPTFSVGDYALDQEISDLHLLSEVSAVEYASFGVRYVGQRIYKARSVQFLGRPWRLTIGVVSGRIYKIAPYMLLKTKADANEIAESVLAFCYGQLNAPQEKAQAGSFGRPPKEM